MRILIPVLISLLVAMIATRSDAQDTPLEELVVGVYVSPPFVLENGDGSYSGMAIDLWETVTDRMDLAFRYTTYPTFGSLVRATAGGELDAAVTNLTITRERAEQIAFSQPWYDAGLRIMVPSQGGGGFRAMLNGLQDAGHLRAYIFLLSMILIATIGLSLFDRRFDPHHPRRWRESIAESFYQVMSIITSGRTARKNLFGWVGRIWQAIWLIVGVTVIAYITSSVTSVMTTVSLIQGISALSDLPGNTVGVLSGSVSEKYMREMGIATRSYVNIDASVVALREGRLDAVVGDAPILEHYVLTHPKDNLAVVGNLFHPDKYGFAFPHESNLTIPTTLELLELQEDGTLENLRLEYFGRKN